jgi:hypothetical protein
MARINQTERDESIRNLRGMLKPGMTVYTILRHCSASGMLRVIDLVIPVKEYTDVYPKLDDGKTDWDAKPKRKYTGMGFRTLSWNAARAMNDTFDRQREGIKVSGCGMDMGFHLVYNLGATLWPKGTKKPHSSRNGEPDTSGGYALKQRWL